METGMTGGSGEAAVFLLTWEGLRRPRCSVLHAPRFVPHAWLASLELLCKDRPVLVVYQAGLPMDDV